MSSRILYLSGNRGDARTLARMLESLPLTIDHAGTLRQAQARLRDETYDVVLAETEMPDGGWLDALHLVRECPHECHVVVTGPHADARLWAEALNLGAYDVLVQPFYQPEVRRILSNACSRYAAV